MNNIEERARKLGLSKEVYAFLMKSGRKIRYLTYDLKYDIIIINDEDIVFIPSREDSLDRLKDEGIMFAADEKSVEDIVIDNLLREQLHKALAQIGQDRAQEKAGCAASVISAVSEDLLQANKRSQVQKLRGGQALSAPPFCTFGAIIIVGGYLWTQPSAISFPFTDPSTLRPQKEKRHSTRSNTG